MTQTENFQTSLVQINLVQNSFKENDLPLTVISNSPEETLSLGENLARFLKKGSILAIEGPIGAGKTCLVKGIASGLGIEGNITSPSYTIISEYDASIDGEDIRFFHIDAYRLRNSIDFSDIGGEEIIFGDGISVIEWSERIPGFILDGSLRVEIKICNNDERKIRVYR